MYKYKMYTYGQIVHISLSLSYFIYILSTTLLTIVYNLSNSYKSHYLKERYQFYLILSTLGIIIISPYDLLFISLYNNDNFHSLIRFNLHNVFGVLCFFS